MKKEYIEFAFPKVTPEGDSPQKGMDLRDYFAAKAMQAAISNEFIVKVLRDNSGTEQDFINKLTQDAYKTADAMLKERVKP